MDSAQLVALVAALKGRRVAVIGDVVADEFVYGRVARVIVDMARDEGRRLKDGRIAFRRATHQEIANRIGTTRETVTRMLKDLERQGMIHVEGREIVVQPDFEKVFD